MPRVSVIIPTYNRKEWLQQAIDSVLDQTYSDFELIVVDDGSTDGTKEILQSKYQDQIRYVYQENQGESKARNNGANIGTGEFLAFLDSDDLWLPMKLQQQVDYLDHHQEVGAVFCLAWSINETGQLNPRFPYGHQFLASEFSLKRILRDPSALGGNSTVVIRKTAFNHLGGFDEKITYGEDFDFCLRLFSCGFQPVLMRSPLASIRTHSSSQSISLNTKKIDQELSDHLIIYNKVKATNSEKEINDYTEVARLKKYFKVFGYYLYTSDHLNVLKFQKIIKEEFPAGLSNEKMYDRIIDYYIPRVFESTHDQKRQSSS